LFSDLDGKYVIQVSRFDPSVKDEDGNPLKVLSNTITVTITGRQPDTPIRSVAAD
jgi:hypothetical protein